MTASIAHRVPTSRTEEPWHRGTITSLTAQTVQPAQRAQYQAFLLNVGVWIANLVSMQQSLGGHRAQHAPWENSKTV